MDSWAESAFPMDETHGSPPPKGSLPDIALPVTSATNGKASHPAPTAAPLLAEPVSSEPSGPMEAASSVEPSNPPAADPPPSPDKDSVDTAIYCDSLSEVAEALRDGPVDKAIVCISPEAAAQIDPIEFEAALSTYGTVEPRKDNHDPDAMLAIFRSLDRSEQVRENYTRVPIGYPGSKSKSIGQILPHLPYRRSYCEPFGGSGSVLLARHACDLEVYNDRYGGIVSFYRCLRDSKKWTELREKIELTVHSREEFIYCKETWDSQDVTDDVDRAYRWYYMHQNSFGHQERNFGRAGKGGKNQHGAALRNNAKLFAPVHYRLKNVLIENLDWRQILNDFDHPENVFYLDPPYVRFAKGIYRHNMSVADHRELLERIQNLDSFVALSGYYDPETVELYGKYEWDKILTWSVASSAVAMAFTETNNRAGHEDTIKRHKTVEALWIRESPCK